MENKERIVIYRNGKTINGYIDGTNYSRRYESKDDAKKEWEILKAYYKNDEKEKIIQFFDKKRMIDVIPEIVKAYNSKNYYVDGINIPLPEKLISRILEFHEEGFDINPLINFWKLLVTNPNKHVIENLFSFADRFNFPITKYGYFIAYKSVAWVGEKHKEYALKVSSDYIYRKASNLPVDVNFIKYENENTIQYLSLSNDELNEHLQIFYDEWFIEKGEEVIKNWINNLSDGYVKLAAYTKVNDTNKDTLLNFAEKEGLTKKDIYETIFLPEIEFENKGKLEDLFKNLPKIFESEKMFTDWHTRSMNIKLGQVVEMPMDKCNTNPSNTCSSGLHVGAPGYVKSFYGGNNRYIIATLVNPADVAAIPEDYSFEKMRTSRYFPYAVCEFDEQDNLKEVETKYFEEDYRQYEINALEEKLKKYELTAEDMDNEKRERKEFTIKDIQEIIKNRIEYLKHSVNS